MLRAIYFDIDDTLFSTTEFAWYAREQAVEAMRARGLQASKEEALRELTEVVTEFGSNDGRHFNRLLDRLPASATVEANRLMLVTAGVIAYHETKWRELQIRPVARDLLEFLGRTTLRLGVITAGLSGKQMEKILRLGLDQFIDPRLIAITDEQGIAKTNPKLYRDAVDRASVQPEQAMHVGDHPHHDVDSAKRAGMLTTWHRGSGKYAALEPKSAPDHVIDDLAELRGVLEQHYDIQPA